jgi:hypothetical protein
MDLFGEYQENEQFLIKTKAFIQEFEKSEVVLWGNSRLLSTFLRFVDNLNIKYIVDINKDLWGTYFNGYEIVSPQNIKEKSKNNVKVIIMLSDSKHIEISNYIKNLGFDINDFCLGKDYLIAYNFYKKNKVVVHSFELVITSVCSLRCTHCIAKIPYFNENISQQIPFDNVKKSIDKIFQNIDYIEMFQLATGEVLLHKDLDKILEYIHQNYKDKYNSLTFVTSGTVLPNERIFKALQKYINFIQVSPYNHPDVKKLLKIDKLHALFDKYKIKYFFSNYATDATKDDWNDIGDFTKKKNRTTTEHKEFYYNCTMNVCKSMIDDKIFPCTVACYNYYGGINKFVLDRNNLDYIDITSEKIDIVRFYLNATKNQYPSICDYCDGIGTTINDKLVIAGKQVKRKN